MKSVLITGANGFVGYHLAKELLANGRKVIGVGGPLTNARQRPVIENYSELDLSNSTEANKIDFTDVDGVIHLAGLAAVGPSFDDPMKYITVNAGIQVNLFETALRQNIKPRFLIVSSGSLYDQKAKMPIDESSPVLPNSPYAVSKLAQEHLAQYYASRGFEVIIARPFNHIGPRQGPGFIVPDLVQQLVSAENGKVENILTGNLSTSRDYTDVRDIARAYRLLLEKGRSGEIYNICSGTCHSGQEILDILLKNSVATPKHTLDPAKSRPADTPIIYGSHRKITEATGWMPSITIEKTLTDVLEDMH